ncbi:universal stress protein [Streptomyces sp. NPDC051896]|uniref:universal stress protein n=1 Tax=Streptomyces sp. NPDC051896 TaxID=3155416 RepID=UPI003428DF7B
MPCTLGRCPAMLHGRRSECPRKTERRGRTRKSNGCPRRSRAGRTSIRKVPVLPDVVLLHPAYALIHTSQRADLLVLGRHSSPRAAERRLGPVTHAVLHHSRCPVVIVPHA